MSLEDYGWNSFFSRSFERLETESLVPARVVAAASGFYRVVAGVREGLTASLAGKLRHEAPRGALPAVGDWVAVEPENARIHRVLPRRTKLSRKVAGKKTEEQVVAANVDSVLVVMALDSDFNLRRLERFLTTVWESGASPLVLLTKTDLCSDVPERKREAEDAAPGVPVVALSPLDGRGVDEVAEHLRPRETSVLVGSSGVGKSTLINRLMGREVQATREVRAHDDRGRHTTADRELFPLPGGALLIDSPGVREIQLFGVEESLERTFADVDALAAGCRFSDCSHRTEPGCAVLEAVGSGELPQERLASFRTLKKELRYLQIRQDESAQQREKQKWKAIHREMRRSGRHRRT